MNENIFGSSKELNLVDAEKIAASNDFEIKAFSMVENVSKEQSRSRNIVRIGLIQNKIHADTSAPVQDQFMAIYNRIEKMIDAAGDIFTEKVIGPRESQGPRRYSRKQATSFLQRKTT